MEMSDKDKLVFLYGFLMGLKTKLKPEDQSNVEATCKMLNLEALIVKQELVD